jgi:orotidine-5'-phosphate decarboxylase
LTRQSGKDRLIVALDLPTAREALDLVDLLEPEVSFYKIGWQLFLTGDLRTVFDRLAERHVFLDLKVPPDIGNTIRSVIGMCLRTGVRFLTLSDSVRATAIRAAREARGENAHPKLLTVPLLSSQDETDLEPAAGERDLGDYLAERAGVALAAGCDGLIASGREVAALRRWRRDVLIVSPGIRPTGSPSDDHKRLLTPSEAIRAGADFLVVGRPIRNARDPRSAARAIIAEMDAALLDRQPAR